MIVSNHIRQKVTVRCDYFGQRSKFEGLSSVIQFFVVIEMSCTLRNKRFFKKEIVKLILGHFEKNSSPSENPEKNSNEISQNIKIANFS